MARFVETFKDWIVSYPNRYKLTENGQEKTVEIERDWEADVEGTSNNEIVMNELVKNITYDTDTVHTTEGGTSVYTCDLVGMKEFIEYSSSDSSFIPKISAQINTTNSNQLSKIRISGKDGSVSDYDLYTINNGVYSLLGSNKLKANTIVIIKIVSNGANKIAVVQYLMDDKLNRGTYPGTASDIKTEIDGKLDKYKNIIDTTIDYDDIAADGFYIAKGLAQGALNAPFADQALVLVFRFAGYVRQEAISYYSAGATACRIFSTTAKNTPWVINYNAANLDTAGIVTNFAKGNVGLSGNIRYIQTAGTKVANEIYWDNASTPPKPYLCIAATTDITPTSNFIAADNKNLAWNSLYKSIDFSGAHSALNKANLEVYGKLCILSAEIATTSATTLLMSNVIPVNYGSQMQIRVGGVSRDATAKGASVDIIGRNIQVTSYNSGNNVIYTTASWIRA